MSFSNLLPRSPWTPPHQPASRDNQPASPYSKRQATYPSQPVTQPVFIRCFLCRVMSSIRLSARR